jgi:primosomal protein N' (replication factor Y)
VRETDFPSPSIDAETYAAVVVDVDAPGLRQPFTYRVAAGIAAELRVGSCVVVPFGKREAIGYVVGLAHEPPEALETQMIRDIEAVVAGAGLPGSVLQTAQWMARTYLADFAQCVRSAVPDAQTAHIVRRIALAAGWEEALAETTTRTHRSLLNALSSFPGGATTEAELAKAIPDVPLSSPLQILRKRGVLVDRWSLEAPTLTPRLVRSARLLVEWEIADGEAAKRGVRAPAQARLLTALVAHGGPMPLSLLLQGTGASRSALTKLEADRLVVVEANEERRRPYRAGATAAVPPTPTAEQETALEGIRERLDIGRHNVALLYGVTASGKTEVYLQAIAEARRRGRTALVLVPEIALTAQVVDTFRARIGDRVAVLHSALSDGERRDEWQRIGSGAAEVVVGARSAVFAPLENVGLIVVDEEHEGSYKQDNPSPRYHARDVAIARARSTGATVLLGSATPAVETFFRAESGEWGLLPLRQRALARPLPAVEIVDLREGYKKGAPPPGVFSPPLQEAIADRLAKGEQTILFLNRRGFASFLLCRDCGYSTRCPHCDVSLTYHARALRLACHHCGYERPAPTLCPSCNGDRIRPFGIGTEKVEEEVCSLFPDARVLRMDRDTTARKNSHQEMLRTFRSGAADILIGTQMVAKGLDFAGVTLVGVVSADTALNLPDFRASERAFQLLTQVAGRAGRGRTPGNVIVQTFNPEHESVVAAAEHDFETFYRREIGHRRELGYPPFTRMANIISQDADSAAAERRLHSLSAYLGGRPSALLDGSQQSETDDGLVTLGPAPCPLSRLRNRYRWHLLIRCPDPEVLRQRLRAALGRLSPADRRSLNIDIDPMSLL